MKVLHVYHQDQKLLANYISQLQKAMPATVENFTASNTSEQREILEMEKPNIVHIHGTGVGTVPSNVRVVYSPHGETAAVSNAYVTIAQSKMEAARLKCPRVEIVKNPIITKTTDFKQAADAIAHIYQKVMDSHPLELMDDPTRQALATLLKAGITSDREWVKDENTAHADFRLIYIYAELEGVLDIVMDGIKTIGIDAPQKEHTESYLPENYQVPSSMKGNDIAKMLDDMRENGPTLRRLTDIDRALRSDSLHERKLIDTLEEKKLKPLFQSVLCLLKEQTHITEGFMPCEALDNNETKRLRLLLSNHLKL